MIAEIMIKKAPLLCIAVLLSINAVAQERPNVLFIAGYDYPAPCIAFQASLTP